MNPAETYTQTQVLVLLLESRSYARWAEFAEKNSWVVVSLLSTGQALRELRSRRPTLSVIEMSEPIDRSLRLLRLLRARRSGLPVVAVPMHHTRQLELTVREIGVAGYSPEGCGSEALADLVTAMLKRTMASRRSSRTRNPMGAVGAGFGLDDSEFQPYPPRRPLGA